ncbi:unnamed protein product [Caenorhabditis bovis]|uniref:Uncharacterized protein n=1 Tax=Caenorhabditis bovis TaxID=2654633 RepID=A0A8S1EUX7_9PELO|nr:unnamed protein product [Caenorhabditis bovis]
MSHEDQENYGDQHMEADQKYENFHDGAGYSEHADGDNGGYRGRGAPPGMRGGFRGRGMPPGYPPSGFPPFRGRGAPPGLPGAYPPPRGRGFPPAGFPPRGRGFPPMRGAFAGNYRGAGQLPPGYGAYGMQPQVADPLEQEGRLKRLAGCADGEELWVETETAEGKKYFYHPVNRNTVWEKPENARIINQTELAELISRSAEEERKEREEKSTAGANPDDAWSEFTAPDGRKYYYNSITQENTWEKPKALIAKEEGEKEPAMDPAQAAAIAEAQAKAQAALAAFMAQKANSANGGGMPLSKAQASGAAAAAAVNAEAAKKKDLSRPTSSTPVSGTPWCVVWTGDGKVFFYNPSTKTSVWERPPDTFGREDVDLLISKPPETKKETPKEKDSSDDSDENDDDGPPKAKKSRSERKKEALMAAQKVEKNTKEKPRQMLQKPVDPAIQAELQAAQEREKIPLEERLKQFKEMLHERGVSTGTTFEKELSKIVFDKRYLLLSATERRASFEAYVREKVEAERAERKKKAKEAKEKFQELLKEAELHGKSSFSSFSSKFGKDSRFKGVERMRDREDMFNDFVGELYKKEKEEKKAKKEKLKAAFVTLLEEQTGLTRKSKWSHVKKTLENDERYIALDSSSTREALFKDFIEKLADETASDIEEEQERERRLAAEAAIANRQREVEAELGDQLRERNRESEKHRMAEHEEKFKALLIDLVKSVDSDWHESRRLLRKDDRYAECDLLDKQKKEALFDDHIRSLERKRRDAFFVMLDNHAKITPTMRWKEAKRIIQDEEEVFSKVASNSERKVERDFRDWQEKRHDQLVDEFKEMLVETKIITHKSKKLMEESEQHLKDILSVLEKDNRWIRMTEMSANERDRLLEEYVDNLYRKGTPPPPTQQERERRK